MPFPGSLCSVTSRVKHMSENFKRTTRYKFSPFHTQRHPTWTYGVNLVETFPFSGKKEAME